jgi:tetratricopeptide (TPR) repeat protein
LSRGDAVCADVADRDEILRRIRELHFEREQLKRRIGWGWRRILALLGVFVLFVGAVGIGLWLFFPQIVEERIALIREKVRAKLESAHQEPAKKEIRPEKEKGPQPAPPIKEQAKKRVDRGIMRSRLEADIKKKAGEKIAEAGEDWRQVIEVEKSRDHQIADLSRNFDRIVETLESGEASERYRRAAELLESNGASAALDYLKADGKKQEEPVESKTERRDREESDLRKLLHEDLLEAFLLETRFQFDAAEAKYRAVVEKAPRWPRARNDLARFLVWRGTVIDPEKGKGKLLEAANLCLRTLAFTKLEDSPRDWAMTQNNFGNALGNLGIRSSAREGREGREQLEVAVSAYRSALEVMTREDLPEDWARTQYNLGTALSDLGIRSKGSLGREELDAAVAAYRSALEVRTEKGMPEDWAMTQNALGNALSNLGIRSDGDEAREYLEAAVAAYRNALKVRTQELSPEDWATSQNNLGTALTDLGAHSDEDEARGYLEAAVAAYRSALKVRSREELPQEWATTLNNLVDALTELAGVSADEKREALLEEAAKGYETLIAASEEEVIQKSAEAGFLGDFSFFKLRRNDPEGAMEAAKKGLELDPRQIWIRTNLLTAYLLLDEWKKAEAIMTENALELPYGEEAFWQVMLNDFDELQRFGVSHPNIKRMREYITAHYNPEAKDAGSGEQGD